MNLFLGIDPGVSGAWAVIDENEVVQYADCFTSGTFLTFYETVYSSRISMAALEKVASMHGQGVTSVFTFGENFGYWKGVLSTLRIKHLLITPATWQSNVLDFEVTTKSSVKGESDKEKNKRRTANRKLIKDGVTEFVLRYFPASSNFITLKKHQGIADALCLALFAKRTWTGEMQQQNENKNRV